MNTTPGSDRRRDRPRLEVLSPAAIRPHPRRPRSTSSSASASASRRSGAQAIWAAHGATVDRETGIVKVPGARHRGGAADGAARLHARRPRPGAGPAARRRARLPRHGRLRHRGPGPVDARGPAVHAWRTSADIARVADALRRRSPSTGWRCPRRTCPPETRSLEELAAVWRNSTKHVQTESVVTAAEAAAAIEMAAAIAGGRDALRARPRAVADAVHDQPARPRRRRRSTPALVAAEAGDPGRAT